MGSRLIDDLHTKKRHCGFRKITQAAIGRNFAVPHGSEIIPLVAGTMIGFQIDMGACRKSNLIQMKMNIEKPFSIFIAQ